MLAQIRIVGDTSEAKVPEVNRIKDQERSSALEPADAPPAEPRSESTGPIILRRSALESRAPEWHKDYHISGTA